IHGAWPAVADEVQPADVVVCHHVVYNVADLAPFAHALQDHARRRVVVELTAQHPLVATRELWRHFHDLDRPTGPSAADAAAVLHEAGIQANVEEFDRPSRWHAPDRAALVAFTRRRLCLTSDRDPEVDRLLGADAWAPRRLVTLWWDAR